MSYVITYYNEALQAEILKLPDGLLSRYLALTDRMETYGAKLACHTKAFGSGLFELRLKSAEGIAREFYWTLVGQRIVMLHNFIKKARKTPTQDVRIAQTRMKEIKNVGTR